MLDHDIFPPDRRPHRRRRNLQLSGTWRPVLRREYRCIAIPRMISENDGIECPIPLSILSSQWPGRRPLVSLQPAAPHPTRFGEKKPMATRKDGVNSTVNPGENPAT